MAEQVAVGRRVGWSLVRGVSREGDEAERGTVIGWSSVGTANVAWDCSNPYTHGTFYSDPFDLKVIEEPEQVLAAGDVVTSWCDVTDGTAVATLIAKTTVPESLANAVTLGEWWTVRVHTGAERGEETRWNSLGFRKVPSDG